MVYRFDDVEIDGEAFRLTRGGTSIRLEPKALELLLFLVANAGRLVTKAEIQEAVWKDTFVTESALTRLVAQIRRALGDDARGSRYVETVPTRGYRFVAKLEPAPSPAQPSRPASVALPGSPAPTPASAAARTRPGRRAAAAAVALVAVALALAAIAAARVWIRHPRSSAANGPIGPFATETQVSTGAELNLFPRFSPEGATLAYSTLRRGSLEIVRRALAPGAREVSVTSDGQQNLQPAFSPDGRLIAYHSLARGGIWVVPALGGVPRRLTTFGSAPAWSPDGSQIAFQGQSWVGAGETLSAASEGSMIWLVPAEGGEPRQLTWIEDVGPGGQGGPSWSPDGRLLVFLAGTRVVVVPVRHGPAPRTTSRGVRVHGVAWEKSGRTQIWTGTRSGNWFAWRVPVDPGTGEVSGEPVVLAGGGETASAWSQPAPSPDGLSIAYVTFRTRHEILAQAVAADGSPLGAPSPLVSGVAGRKVPVGFSPDGRRFAFTTLRPGVGVSVWLADLPGGESRLVAEDPAIQISRAWFPDGQRLGYASSGPQGTSFRSVDVDTGETAEHRRLPDRLSWAPLLSPDGRSLLSHGALNGRLNVWRLEVRGGDPRPLTADTEGAGWPVWSPDGRSVALELMRAGNTRIGLMPSSGGPVRELVATPGQNWPNAFSPDGRRVAFAGQRLGVWNVYWAALAGGAEKAVSAYTSPAVYVRYPDWSPRGDRIAYEYAESSSTVWIAPLAAGVP